MEYIGVDATGIGQGGPACPPVLPRRDGNPLQPGNQNEYGAEWLHTDAAYSAYGLILLITSVKNGGITPL